MLDIDTNTIFNRWPHELLICDGHETLNIMMPWGQSWSFNEFKKSFNFEYELLTEKGKIFKSEEEKINQIYNNLQSKYFKEDTTIIYQNKQCKHYPCKKNIRYFNCKFCVCPLYFLDDCNGEYTIDNNGVKHCDNCTIPYDGIIGYYHILQTLRKYKVDLNDKF